MTPSPKAILIAGPTASGKSRLALRLAEATGGTVVNADSMQVYRELRILTARPSVEDEARLPHALYGHVPGAEAYSAGRFAREAADIFQTTRARGSVPIFVGGTGLYLKVLLEGLSPVPPIDEAWRRYWRQAAARLGAEKLHATLADRDPGMASRLGTTDTQRIVRALEVLDSTGQSLAAWQSLPRQPVIADASGVVRLVVRLPREVLYRRAEERFDAMLAAGAMDEVASLLDLARDPELPALRALGVRELLRVARGEQDLSVATAAAKAETRRYIKRQETWLKSNMIAWMNVNAQEMESEARKLISFIRC